MTLEWAMKQEYKKKRNKQQQQQQWENICTKTNNKNKITHRAHDIYFHWFSLVRSLLIVLTDELAVYRFSAQK